jgi:hypothetical protein
MKKAEPRAIGGRAVDGETLFTPRFDPHAFMPRDRMTYTRLRGGRCDHDRVA